MQKDTEQGKAVLNERMNTMQAEYRSGFDRVQAEYRSGLDGLRAEFRAGFELLSNKLDAVNEQWNLKFESLRMELRGDIAKQGEENARREARLLLAIVSLIAGGMSLLVAAMALFRFFG